MNKKLIKMRSKEAGKIKEWTLIQNQDYLKQTCFSIEKKSRG